VSGVWAVSTRQRSSPRWLSAVGGGSSRPGRKSLAGGIEWHPWAWVHGFVEWEVRQCGGGGARVFHVKHLPREPKAT